jgi:hypothetical protein
MRWLTCLVCDLEELGKRVSSALCARLRTRRQRECRLVSVADNKKINIRNSKNAEGKIGK